MIKTQSEKTHEEIFKKLTETYTSKINKKKSIKNIGELTEIYYSKIKQTWFSLIEDEQKYYYIFGKYDSPNDINPQNNSLIIDFTKTEKYDENCLGIINHKNIYINKINLLKKYPNINLNNFTSKHLLLFQYTYQNISSIDLGHINKDFIENLEKLIKEIVNNPLEKSKNLFLNSIKAGKTVEQSLKIAKISQKELNDWLEFGKNKNNIHHEFYEDYFKLVNSGKSKTANDNLMNEYDKIKKDNKNIDFGDEITETTNIKMNVFLNEYKKDKNLNNSLKKSNIDYYLFNLWIKQGKQPSNKYNKFYKEFNKIRETSKIKKDPKKSSKNSQLMNDFIKLKHEGKTNEEIIKKLEIPEFLVKNWVNQGKLGNVKYIDFYEAYRLNNKPKSKKVDNKKESKIDNKKESKVDNKKESKVDNKKEINIDSDERKCIICGRTLNKNYKKDICKRCTRKRYAVKILGKLLSSIEPEIPFKQDDLKALNLDNLQIQDYIWTLKEFNLITEKDSKLMLKKREILDKFAEECESEIIIKDNSISLSKTCETCGKTLEISNFLTSEDNKDGYENDCKDCKKLINSAIFLKELNKYIKWDQEFTEEDLTPHFKDPFILKGNIWNLQDNDLIKNNLNSDKYVLTDKKTGMDFIEKYYKEKYDTPTTKKVTTNNTKIESHKNTKKNQIQTVLDAISRKRTRKEASIIAEIPLYKITHWFNEGRQGFGDENINFYNKLKSLEKTTKPYSFRENVKQINLFIDTLKECKDIEKTCEKTKISTNIIDDWFILGKKDMNPFNIFTDEYNKINENTADNEDEEYNSIVNQAKRKIFLEYINQGFSIEDSCKQASLEVNILDKWINNGKNNIPPYNEFYNKYKQLSQKNKHNDKIDEYKSIKNILKRKQILEGIKLGKTYEEACKSASLDINLFNIWVKKGKDNIPPFNEFYENIQQNINKNKIKNEYYSFENRSKRNVILNQIKSGQTVEESCEYAGIDINLFNEWIKKGKNNENPYKEFYLEYNSLQRDGKDITDYKIVTNEAKRKIFLEYIKNGSSIEKSCEQASLDKDVLNLWLSKGKNRVEPYYEFLKKYEKIQRELKQQQEDKEIQNEIIEIIKNGSSIKEAAKQYKKGSYEKSILSWYEYGKIGDEKYKEFYKQCKEYEIDFFNLIKQGYDIEIACEKSNLDYEHVKNKLINKEDGFYNSYIEAKILNEIGEYPLIKPEKYKDNHSITLLMNRIIKLLSKGKTEKEACKIADFPYDTYKYWINRGKQNMGEVYVDFYNEIKSIKQLKSKIDDELNNNLNETNELTFDSKKYEKYKFLLKPVHDYPGKGNRTGFAWTNKIGKQWIYTKSINKKQLKISDENFFKLYEKVISQKQIWGFIDKEKALQTVKNEENEDPNWNLDVFLEICRNLNPQEFDNSEQKEHIAKDILDPLPDKFEENFQKPSKTGFAWVNKTSNKWTYSRSFNGETVVFRNDNIYNLFNEVIENKLTWGVRNLKLAEKSLNENKIPKSPVENINNAQDIPNLNETIELLPEKYKDILKPIDEKNKDNFWTESVSGFAWVDKLKDNWRYSHSVNGKRKYFSAENIFLIYDYANKNNCGWGVRDYDKAISLIKEELNQINTKETSNTTSEKENNMFISYLSRDESHINILIKGLISENELFNYLSNLNEFEKYITRILTNKINEKIDILIELDLDKNLLSKFEKEMKKLGWK